MHKDVLALVRKRFAYLAHHEGILVCWACAVPVADQVHKCGTTPPIDDDGSTLGEDAGRAQPGPSTRPARACTRTPSCPQPTEHNTETCIRACVKNILARRLHVGGLTCHYAPAAQPARVPYGHGGIIGVPFEYRSGRSARVYLVAPALEFVKPSHGPHESFSTSQLRAYYRSTPDMQHPTPVYDSVPLCQRIQPEPPSAPDPRIAPPTVHTAPGTHQPATPHTARPEDAELLRQYHRIAHIISARHAVNSERGGGSTARRILSHGFGGFSHNSRTCRDVYKRISLVAHPDKHPMRNAYYRAVADIVMEVTRRASDIVTSPSSSDRAAFPPVPALDSAQFSTLVNSHRRVARDNNPLMRSATTPPVAMKDGGSLMGTTPYSSDMRRTRSLPLSSSVAPCVLESHMVSASDAFPDTTPASQRHTQTTIGDHFSDIDEDEQEDEHASRSSDADMDDEARPLIGDTSVSRGTCDDTDVRIITDVTDLGADADDVLSDTELPRDSRAGSYSPPRLLMAPHHGLDRPTPVAAPATAHVAAPLPLDVVRDPDVGAVAAVAHTTDTGVVMDTDPNPVTTDVPTDEHISLFLRHARRCAEDTATGLAVDTAPPDTSTGVVIGPTPGVATPVVVVGPTTDGDVGTADGALPYDDDFDPITAGSDRDEVTAVAPDGADLEPTSPDLASTRGSDTTAAMPVGTGRVVDGVSDGGFGTDDFADEVLSDDVVDFDPHSAWDGGDEITAALRTVPRDG